MKIYLDNSATTPLSPSTKQFIINALDTFGNPSSLHQEGMQANKLIFNARKSVAKFINADTEDIIFTPSGSASNCLGIKGYIEKHNCILFYSPLLHKSALKCIESLYMNKEVLKVDSQGFIDTDDLESRMNPLKLKPFVVIEYANSEIGTIQEVKKIIDITHKWNGVVYLDCTGSISTIELDVKSLDVDMVGFSAHKIGGLKGCAVLYKKKNIQLEPLVYGTQEQNLIGGTQNTLGIVTLGHVVEHYDYSSVSFVNRDYVYDYIINNISGSYLVGAPIDNKRLSYNLYMCFKGVEGESLMMLLDINGIDVSTGSACSSGSLEPSSTLVAIGMNNEDIHSCIRMSFSGNETREELNFVCTKLKDCVEQLRNFRKDEDK